ncbi:MAG: hypothetical protein RR922_05075 [Clostridia bacterium]
MAKKNPKRTKYNKKSIYHLNEIEKAKEIMHFNISYIQTKKFGKHIVLRDLDKVIEELAYLDFAENVKDLEIPYGEYLESEYSKVDYTYNLLVFHKDNYVYIMNNGDSNLEVFESVYKVRKDIYLDAFKSFLEK